MAHAAFVLLGTRLRNVIIWSGQPDASSEYQVEDNRVRQCQAPHVASVVTLRVALNLNKFGYLTFVIQGESITLMFSHGDLLINLSNSFNRST